MEHERIHRHISGTGKATIFSACAVTLSYFGHSNRSCLLTYLLTSHFARTFIRTKARYKFWESSHGRSRGLPKIFRARIYRAHRAVIFSIAHLSCTCVDLLTLCNLYYEGY